MRAVACPMITENTNNDSSRHSRSEARTRCGKSDADQKDEHGAEHSDDHERGDEEKNENDDRTIVGDGAQRSVLSRCVDEGTEQSSDDQQTEDDGHRAEETTVRRRDVQSRVCACL